MLGPYDLALFDLDGTLVDSTPAVTRSWLSWAEEEGIDPHRLFGLHGVPAAAVVELLLPPERVGRGRERIEALELADLTDVLALPGARELLTGLPATAWGIVTSCTAPLAAVRISVTGLPDPAILVTADEVARGKPDPEPYLLGAERAGVAPGRCVVVEDAPAGIVSARAAGMAVVAVATTHEPGALDADLVLPGIGSLAVQAGPEGLLVGERH